ncbi:MAG TPA: bifunctional phosphopantothenoylcysteine decarboxylase/phosphopantothenate--cysteine ligase CoaBC [Mariprofundaceae bacterium]|nr:bifunctional phosphopantothenoylcysteine decarboxylase/phosphopantothenate--cysteine ligase CoaBC [Mariprofundaceae bacterium]
MLTGKRILIGIGGGIAVYRVAELARLLMKQGAEVRCVMTKAAQQFVTPLTFEALTGEAVHSELFDLTAERTMGHIALARWADVLLLAPATANLLAKHAYGIADDLLTTLLQVREGPVLAAPAMNVSMWRSPATQANVAILRERGVSFIGPVAGALACGEEGEGRLAEPEAIVAALLPLVSEQKLAGQRWVINAGPTREGWDDVRVLSNRASGRLGVCLAEAAAAMGARVTLVAGPGTPASLAGFERVDVETAHEMQAACESLAKNADVFVATAAVSDYRFAAPVEGKIKREGRETLQAEFAANPDIVAGIAAMPERPRKVIAFAAERSDHVAHARDKLARKKVDAVVANDASRMGAATGSGWWVTVDKVVELPEADKAIFAQSLIEQIQAMGWKA